MNKTAAVRAALLNGEVLTIRSISRTWDINCPYGVIRDIRNAGVNVLDRQTVGKTGIKYKEYFI